MSKVKWKGMDTEISLLTGVYWMRGMMGLNYSEIERDKFIKKLNRRVCQLLNREEKENEMNTRSVDTILYPLINLPTEFADEKYIGKTCIICGFPFGVEVRKEAIKKAKQDLLALLVKEVNKTSVYSNGDSLGEYVYLDAVISTLTRLFSKGAE
jgi:hypothetical protein